MVDSNYNDYDSPTKNQHFISQAEQRLNASNPSTKRRSQRIHKFSILSRDQPHIKPTSQRGVSICNSLSYEDLFSFDILDKKVRSNFERVFGHYEAKIAPLTNTVLQENAGTLVTQGAFDLFVAKMVNYVRNPFSIIKVLNTFGAFAGYHPTDPAIYRTYERLLIGSRPHQSHLCMKFGVTTIQYEQWLRILFMLLTPPAPGHTNMLEQTLSSLFQDRNNALKIYVHTYASERCLLSDRGWTLPIEQEPHLVFDFNLNAHAFIRYAFFDYDALPNGPLPPRIKMALSQGPKQVPLYRTTNDLQALEIFNRRVVEQSFEHVFCSGMSAYGVTIVS